MNSDAMKPSSPSSSLADVWRVGDVALGSRFLLGTAGYPSPQVLGEAIATRKALLTICLHQIQTHPNLEFYMRW